VIDEIAGGQRIRHADVDALAAQRPALHCSLGRPKDGASATPGWASRAFSTSADRMFSPPLMIISFLRP